MFKRPKVIFSLVLVLAQVGAYAYEDYEANYDIPSVPSVPSPYSFAYDAGRYPGNVDRTHREQGDGKGNSYGSYAYVDPSQQLRTVNYVADAHGFHPTLSHGPVDTEAVKQAKQRHYDLYHKIAQEHASYKGNPEYRVEGHPKDTAAVKHAKANHLYLWEKIAAEHAKLGAEHRAQKAHQSPDYSSYDYPTTAYYSDTSSYY